MVFLTLVGICGHHLPVTQHLRLHERVEFAPGHLETRWSQELVQRLRFLFLILTIQPETNNWTPAGWTLTITLEAEDNYIE